MNLGSLSHGLQVISEGCLRLALAAFVLAVTTAPGGGVWIELATPQNDSRLSAPVPLVEVRGRAGVGVPGRHEVVLVIDRSVSTFASSGLDINQNGRLGHNTSNRFHPVLWTTDFGDTIVQAQVAAARQLIDRLDPEVTRMGLVTFGGTSHLRAGVGSSRADLLAALESLADRPNEQGTYIYGALLHAVRAFDEAPAIDDVPRHRSIILLSDGVPTAPHPPSAAEKAALQAARRAAADDVTIYAYALGPEAAAHRELFDEMASTNGGQLVIVNKPGDVIYFVPHLSLADVSELKIDNLSMSRPARAVRLFPDGSFDGFAPLREGKNRLRITVTTESGLERVVDRSVYFERTPGDTDAARERAQQLLKLLEIRTIETQLAEKAQRKRSEILQRSLEVDIERR